MMHTQVCCYCISDAEKSFVTKSLTQGADGLFFRLSSFASILVLDLSRIVEF